MRSADHVDPVAPTKSAPPPQALDASAPQAPEPIPDGSAQQAPAEPDPASAPTEPTGSTVSVDALRDGWGQMLDGLSTPARARFLAGHINAINGSDIDFVLPTDSQVKRCEAYRSEVEQGIADSFGASCTIRLRSGDQPSASTAAAPTPAVDEMQDESEIDIHDLTDADDASSTVVDRIAGVFPGAEVLEQES